MLSRGIVIGIVIPAHNEEAYLTGCLAAARRAAIHAGLHGEAVEIVVVLDDCSDRSLEIAVKHSVIVLPVAFRNVGRARAVGAEALISRGARWLAFTDADTTVSPGWLVEQLALGADAVCGSVGVADWSPHPEHVRSRYEAGYFDVEDHRHVHGANFGVSTEAYLAAGGFPSLACHEDVALVEALGRIGRRIAWSCKPRVTTSARHEGRARGGFADHLRSLYVEATLRPTLPRPISAGSSGPRWR